MPTIEQSGQLTNREQQVEGAYNDPQHGYISLLQKQIDSSTADAQKANIALQTSQGNLNALEQGLAVMKSAGFNTAGIGPVKNWNISLETVNSSNSVMINPGQASFGSGNVQVVEPAPDIVLGNTSTIDGANLWIAQAQTIIDNINNVVSPAFKGFKVAGYRNQDGKVHIGLGIAQVTNIYNQTFGQTVIDLQNAINDLKGRLVNYQASLATTQGNIDAQSTAVQNAKDAYNAAAAKVNDLNKQMTQLQMQYQQDMAAAADTDAQSAQTALTLQLAANPDYQAAQNALLQTAAKAKADLDTQKEVDTAAATQAQIAAQQAAQLQNQTALQQQATIDAATKAAQTAAATKQRNILIIGAVAVTIVVGVVLVLIFAD